MPVFDHRQGPSERSGRASSRQSAATTRSTSPSTKLLSAQNAAGNQAVVQMLRQAGNSFAQHPQGAGAGAKSGANALPVQRVAKESVRQPTGRQRSAEVPDLPRALAEAIGNAGSSAERYNVLQQLLAYILGRFTQLGAGLGENQADILQNLTQRVVVTYSDEPVGAMAHTEEQLGQEPDDPNVDSPPIVITVYAAAFEGGPAQLYSTMRHELIHAAQRSMVPDEGQAAATDDVMFEDLYEETTGAPTAQTLQLPMQEIETHVWELTHARETGVDAGYRNDTVTYLVQYAHQLAAGVGSATNEEFAYWANYLVRAVRLLNEALTVVTDAAGRRSIQAAAAALQNAINNRMGTGGSKRSGGSSKRSGGSGGGSKRSGGGSGSGSSSKRRRSRRTAA
ncbi:hypothetical protein ACFUCH_00220 [Streptomyces olivaceus]|uniref:hypothetical protein n=1 Tax=Streptomyces olivaceus TaxID=47716 RepID=UPI00363F050A